MDKILVDDQQQQQQALEGERLPLQSLAATSPGGDIVQPLIDASGYKILFDAAPIPYLVVLPDAPVFTCVAANDLYLQSTLRRREDMIGRGMFQAFIDNSPDVIAAKENVGNSFLRVIATKQQDMMAVQKYSVDDPETGKWVTKYCTPINTPVWTEKGMYILHRIVDVTDFMEMKQTEFDAARAETMQHVKRVEQSQTRYQQLMTVLPLGIFHTNDDGDITYANALFERMTKSFGESQVKYTKWYEYQPSFEYGDIKNDNVREMWLKNRYGNNSFRIEYQLRGSWFLLEIVSETQPKMTDMEKGFSGYILDITERKLTEKIQKDRMNELAELDRAKTVFFSNVSHELRTPLTLILGPAEDGLNESGEQALQPRQRERIEVIQRNAQRLLKLVNSSLDFTRLEEGHLKSEFEVTDLGGYTEMLTRLFAPAMKNVNLDFRVHIHTTELAYVDRDAWQKIVFNLLSNALKYTLEGSVTLTLRQIEETQVCLTVQDTGIGIPEKELPKMFQRFHRIEHTSGRSFEGTGIGLSLTQQLVKLHGGEILVSGGPEKGSLFTVYIPLGSSHLPSHMIKQASVPFGDVGPATPNFRIAPTSISPTCSPSSATPLIPATTPPISATDSAIFALTFVTAASNSPTSAVISPTSAVISPTSANPSPTSASTSPTHLKSPVSVEDSSVLLTSGDEKLEQYNILIAEDNSDMRKLLFGLLSKEFSVTALPDGEIAFRAAKQKKFDLVLSDVMMPKMDGFQLTKMLREEETTKAIPIILLSARVDEESRLHGLRSGADDYIVKPFSRKELLQKVRGRLRAGRWRYQLTQKLLDSQDESQRQKRLLQLVSHELRNPLVGIKGNSELVETLLQNVESLLIERKNDEISAIVDQIKEARNAIRAVTQCADYQKIICDDVLDMAKLKEQKMELHLTSFDPIVIVTDALKMLSIRAQESEIKLTTECKMKNRRVSGDATRITQVLVNLISNAVKFTPKQGSIHVALQSPSETTEQIELQFSVQDTGIGMDAEQQTRIFSPFAQASSAIASKFGGTGLGLSISKSLVELMGGQISVTSVLGQGSTFIAKVFCGNVFMATTPVSTISQIKKMQVLIVDDTVINQKILKRVLELAGHFCAVANNGEECLNMWAQMTQVDVILMDVNMPVMGGLEATKRIRQAERKKDRQKLTWIIGLSGDGFVKAAWREAGMDDFIIKPYNQRELLQKVAAQDLTT